MKMETIAEGKYLGLYQRQHGNTIWEYAARPNSTGVVGILPITSDGHVVLVEQFRIPVQNRVIEIPAGLVGDEKEFVHESLVETAEREMLEETGYRAGKMNLMLSSPTSAGMVQETTHFFVATGLQRVGDGGGTEHEDITVHHVPLDGIAAWLAGKQSEGLLIDFKIHACLFLALQQGVISQ